VADDGTGSQGTMVMPFGVQGDASSLHLFVSKVPGEAYGTSPEDPGKIVSDLRRISYWFVQGEGDKTGLARQEVKVITADDANPGNFGNAEESSFVIGPEVKELGFEYYDGSSWVETWDSMTPGADGVTPMGPPRAIAIHLGITQTPGIGRTTAVLKTYRHVVAIQMANGAVPQGGGTTP